MVELNTFLQQLQFTTILKWVITILVTGFIAHFGKMLAEHLAARIRRRKKLNENDTSNETASPRQRTYTTEIEDGKKTAEAGKADKKEIKARLKAEKKQKNI